MLCFFAFFTGFGSCSSFSASIKTGMYIYIVQPWSAFEILKAKIPWDTAASNFPDHRGTATAFPLAAFGLSALFWSTVSAIAFKDDTGKFLLLLTLGTLFLNLIAIPFLRILPPSGSYHRLPNQRESTVESRQLRAARSTDPRSYQEDPDEAGTQSFGVFESQTGAHSRSTSHASNSHHSLANDPDADETSSLVSKPASRLSRDTLDGCNTDEILSNVPIDLPHPDVRGLAMLPKIEFWQLFLTMALLSGIGLMTIKLVPPPSLYA